MTNKEEKNLKRKRFDYEFKKRLISLVWQHILLVFALFFMTLGVALSIRSGLGSGVISSIPMVLSLAGEAKLAPEWTIGTYTYLMNIIFVTLQVIILRRQFKKVQLFQIIIGFLFGFLLDLNMAITSIFYYNTIFLQIITQLIGCTVLGFAVAMEIRCGSITMPGEGIQVAISRVTNRPFPQVKIKVDTCLVIIAVCIGFYYFHQWMWIVVGPGTLFAMFYVGMVVKFANKHLKWFDRLLHYQPGFRRYIYGLARYIYPHREG